MFVITLKRPLAILAVIAGLLVASAGPASAAQPGPLTAPPAPNTTLSDCMVSGWC